MGSSINRGVEAKAKLIKAITLLSDTVSSTLGPGGRNVMIDTGGMDGIQVTKDGVTVARSIYFKDPVENMAVQLLKKVSHGSDVEVGDGSTTSLLLASEMVKRGFKYMDEVTSIYDYMRGMEDAKVELIDFLETLRQEIDFDTDEGKSMIRNISLISSNGDEEITNAVMEGLSLVGKNGVFKIVESGTHKTVVERKDGMHYVSGLVSPYFYNDSSNMKFEGSDVNLLFYGGKFERFMQISNILNPLFNDNNNPKTLVIVANEYSDEFIKVALDNYLHKIPIILVTSPGFGINQKENLEDLAIATGGVAIIPDKNMEIEKMGIEILGRADKVEASLRNFLVLGGHGDQDAIDNRRKELKIMEEKETDNYYKTMYNERFGKFSSGIALIKLGAYSEVELTEKKYRLEDALKAVKNTIMHGYLPGAGFVYYQASISEAFKKSETTNRNYFFGYDTVVGSLIEHPNKLFKNAGLNFDDYKKDYIVLLGKDDKYHFIGIDLKKITTCDLISDGVIDPYMVAVTALNYSVSITKTILTTEAVIYEDEEVDPKKEFGLRQP